MQTEICVFLAQGIHERGMSEFKDTQKNFGIDGNKYSIINCDDS